MVNDDLIQQSLFKKLFGVGVKKSTFKPPCGLLHQGFYKNWSYECHIEVVLFLISSERTFLIVFGKDIKLEW